MTILSAYGVPYSLRAMPRCLQVGIPLIGVQEITGTKNNKTIMAWRDEINLAVGVNEHARPITGYSNDDIPWCGLFEAYIQFKAGKTIVDSPLWARNWAKFGAPVAERINGQLVSYKGAAPSLGDTLVFIRDGGGHVGNYIAEDATHFAVLGGNQGNRVSIMAIEKARCIAVRRGIFAIGQPESVKPFVIKKVPARTSVNEA